MANKHFDAHAGIDSARYKTEFSTDLPKPGPTFPIPENHLFGQCEDPGKAIHFLREKLGINNFEEAVMMLIALLSFRKTSRQNLVDNQKE